MTGEREPLKELVGRRISECRARVKMPASVLADRIEVHAEAMAAIEDGSNWPTPAHLVRMSEALGVPVAAFFTDDSVSVEPTPLECLDILKDGVGRMLRELTAAKLEAQELRTQLAPEPEVPTPPRRGALSRGIVDTQDSKTDGLLSDVMKPFKGKPKP